MERSQYRRSTNVKLEREWSRETRSCLSPSLLKSRVGSASSRTEYDGRTNEYADVRSLGHCYRKSMLCYAWFIDRATSLAIRECLDT